MFTCLFSELLSAFKLFEKSGKGRIPIRELGPLLRSLGRNPSEIELEEARNELDMQGLEGRSVGVGGGGVKWKGFLFPSCYHTVWGLLMSTVLPPNNGFFRKCQPRASTSVR